MNILFYHPQTKLPEGNIFRGVCLSTGGGRSVLWGGVGGYRPQHGVPSLVGWFHDGGAVKEINAGVPWKRGAMKETPPPISQQARALRILLECILAIHGTPTILLTHCPRFVTQKHWEYYDQFCPPCPLLTHWLHHHRFSAWRLTCNRKCDCRVWLMCRVKIIV